ncbi:MAG: hypothetical protein ACK4UN_01545 [Limisphaerales bacterium]
MRRFSIPVILLFLSITPLIHAQTLATWIFPPNVTTNQNLVLAPNQVMEVVSITLDNSASIDVTTGEGQTVTFGAGGNPLVPTPLVVAGPATVSLRKTTSGPHGSLMTFRVTQVQDRQQNSAQSNGR